MYIDKNKTNNNHIPGLFTSDQEFRNKWASILNKCSFDLMLLIIEQSNTEIKKINEKLEALQPSLTQPTMTQQFSKRMETLDHDLTMYHDNLKALKIKKFKRDELDYANKNVYP